jgi:hypothetical protein
MSSIYLNTGLCLISAADLTPLATSIGKEAHAGYCGKHGGKWHTTIFSHGSGVFGKRKPCDDVAPLLRVCGSLRGSAKTLWANCTSRELNIGWQSSAVRREGAFDLDPSLLSDMAKLGVTLAVTNYPSCEEDVP